MAVAEEEIVIIAEDDAAEFDGLQEETETPLDYEAKKKKIIIFGGAAIALTLIILIVLLIVFKSSPELDSFSMDTIEEKLLQNKQKPIEPSKLENMIAKANYLYSSGSKKDALNLYEKIAQYSEAISLYNLGVAQLKNEQYELALTTFQKAINNHEKRCVSAINAAVCSLHLKDEENFKYYIDLAYAYLPNEFNSPLYSYYYTLINYYNKNYLEALSSLANPSSKEYPEVQKHLSAKINALFENNYDAIEAMEKNVHPKDSFSLALLYARVGDLTLAQQYLEDSILKNSEPAKAQLALGFIKLKAGQISSGAKEIQNVTDMFPEEVYKDYPIKVTLKDTLFDAKKAQKAYREKVGNSKLINYQKIFYFSPYKIFNAKQTISYIRKGNANIYIDNIASAKNYLKKSSSSSLVNKGIATAIKKALSFHIRAANNDLQKLIEIQPKHSIYITT
ncbi:MAG: tetratricopeptide repeat protein [Sulfurimonas sp.]|nr:tetratricopeptide repeat protein [Sulfurimonas sp.]